MAKKVVPSKTDDTQNENTEIESEAESTAQNSEESAKLEEPKELTEEEKKARKKKNKKKHMLWNLTEKLERFSDKWLILLNLK